MNPRTVLQCLDREGRAIREPAESGTSPKVFIPRLGVAGGVLYFTEWCMKS